jgi:hypothetical protein
MVNKYMSAAEAEASSPYANNPTTAGYGGSQSSSSQQQQQNRNPQRQQQQQQNVRTAHWDQARQEWVAGEPTQDSNYNNRPSGNNPSQAYAQQNQQLTYQQQAEQLASQRAGFTDPYALGDINTQRRASALEQQGMGYNAAIGVVLNQQYQEAQKTQGTRDDIYYLTEGDKWKENIVERSSAYHNLGQDLGTQIPANPYEYQADLAVEALKGSPEKRSEWFSPVSGEMSGYQKPMKYQGWERDDKNDQVQQRYAGGVLPGGQGSQEVGWDIAKSGRVNPADFTNTVAYLNAAEGKYGPYGKLAGGIDNGYARLPGGQTVANRNVGSEPDFTILGPADTRKPGWGILTPENRDVTTTIIPATGKDVRIFGIAVPPPIAKLFQKDTIEYSKQGYPERESTWIGTMAGGAEVFSYKLATSQKGLDSTPWVSSKQNFNRGEPILLEPTPKGEPRSIQRTREVSSIDPLTGATITTLVTETQTVQEWEQKSIQPYEQTDIGHQMVTPVSVTAVEGTSRFDRIMGNVEPSAKKVTQSIIPAYTEMWDIPYKAGFSVTHPAGAVPEWLPSDTMKTYFTEPGKSYIKNGQAYTYGGQRPYVDITTPLDEFQNLGAGKRVNITNLNPLYLQTDKEMLAQQAQKASNNRVMFSDVVPLKIDVSSGAKALWDLPREDPIGAASYYSMPFMFGGIEAGASWLMVKGMASSSPTIAKAATAVGTSSKLGGFFKVAQYGMMGDFVASESLRVPGYSFSVTQPLFGQPLVYKMDVSSSPQATGERGGQAVGKLGYLYTGSLAAGQINYKSRYELPQRSQGIIDKAEGKLIDVLDIWTNPGSWRNAPGILRQPVKTSELGIKALETRGENNPKILDPITQIESPMSQDLVGGIIKADFAGEIKIKGSVPISSMGKEPRLVSITEESPFAKYLNKPDEYAFVTDKNLNILYMKKGDRAGIENDIWERGVNVAKMKGVKDVILLHTHPIREMGVSLKAPSKGDLRVDLEITSKYTGINIAGRGVISDSGIWIYEYPKGKTMSKELPWEYDRQVGIVSERMFPGSEDMVKQSPYQMATELNAARSQAFKEIMMKNDIKSEVVSLIKTTGEHGVKLFGKDVDGMLGRSKGMPEKQVGIIAEEYGARYKVALEGQGFTGEVSTKVEYPETWSKTMFGIKSKNRITNRVDTILTKVVGEANPEKFNFVIDVNGATGVGKPVSYKARLTQKDLGIDTKISTVMSPPGKDTGRISWWGMVREQPALGDVPVKGLGTMMFGDSALMRESRQEYAKLPVEGSVKGDSAYINRLESQKMGVYFREQMSDLDLIRKVGTRSGENWYEGVENVGKRVYGMKGVIAEKRADIMTRSQTPEAKKAAEPLLKTLDKYEAYINNKLLSENIALRKTAKGPIEEVNVGTEYRTYATEMEAKYTGRNAPLPPQVIGRSNIGILQNMFVPSLAFVTATGQWGTYSPKSQSIRSPTQSMGVYRPSAIIRSSQSTSSLFSSSPSSSRSSSSSSVSSRSASSRSSSPSSSAPSLSMLMSSTLFSRSLSSLSRSSSSRSVSSSSSSSRSSSSSSSSRSSSSSSSSYSSSSRSSITGSPPFWPSGASESGGSRPFMNRGEYGWSNLNPVADIPYLSKGLGDPFSGGGSGSMGGFGAKCRHTNTKLKKKCSRFLRNG